MMLRAFRRSDQTRNIPALYGMIVAQARSATFFTTYGVADTINGRFELIVLHLVLILRRLDRGGGRRDGQVLFDCFCRDLDDNLREMAVGDLAVPRQMRRFAEAFYGRQRAYCRALAGADAQALEQALARNIFGLAHIDSRVSRLACYVRWAEGRLAAATQEALIAGNAVFPSPEAFAHA